MQKVTYAMMKAVDGLSSRDAAKKLGVGKSTIADARNRIRNGTFFDSVLDSEPKRARILTLDIESKPHTVYTWGLWDQNVGINQIVEPGGMICFAAKWLGSDEVLFYSEFKDGYKGMVKAAWDLLSECDILITYNGDRYDVKRLNNEFENLQLGPPKPFKSIDVMKTNKIRLDLPSRKLDYLAQFMGEGAKLGHTGFQLWIDCMANDPDAWKLMEEYNRQDVIITEKCYLRLLPWLTNAPHLGMYSAQEDCCPYCGSEDLVATGDFTHTNVQSYDLYKCSNCSGWVRGNSARGVKLTTRATR